MQRSMLQKHLNDTVTLVKKDGSVARESIRAMVQPKTIFMDDETLPIEPGDRLLRKLPSGLVEDFIVDEPGFYSAIGGMNSHFQTKVRRSSAPAATPATVINNIQGQNARVNINSTDNSENLAASVDNSEILANLLERLNQSTIPEDEVKRLRDAIEEMKEADSKSSFREAYIQFMSAAANHLAVFGPLLGALAKAVQ